MRNWNTKKYNAIRYFATVAMGGVLFIASCNESDDPTPPVEVSFATDLKLVGEYNGPQVVTLKLSAKARKNGSLSLSTSTANAESNLKFPETIDITEGTSFVQFPVYPVNNGQLDGTREVTFEISDPSSGFKLGQVTEMVVNVMDDESPAEANFTEATGAVDETDADGTEIEIMLSSPALVAGNLTVTLSSSSADYGTDYTIDPAPVASVITLPFDAGATSVSFTVFPVDNGEVDGIREVTFTLTSSSVDEVYLGEIIPEIDVAFGDDETPSKITFAAATSNLREGLSTGNQVVLNATPAAQGTASVTVTITGGTGVYGTDYTTDPAAVGGVINLDITTGQATGNIKIVPVANVRIATDKTVTFTITGASGSGEVGDSDLTHTVTINDDDIEYFNYGTDANADILAVTTNWARHSGTVGPAYTPSGLTFTGYAGDGVGGALAIANGSSGDVNYKFGEINSTQTVYVSFLVNLASAGTRDYFFHLGPNTIGTTFRARVYSTLNATGWNISFAKNSVISDNTATLLEFNKTYLVVLKYDFSTATTTDDVVSLYLYDNSVPASEPGTPLVSIANIGAADTSDPANIGSFAVRQGTNTPTGTIDGIRVSTSWNDLFN
jgi:hypothetical protein